MASTGQVRQRKTERSSLIADDVKYGRNEKKPNEDEDIPQDTGFRMLFRIFVVVTFVLPVSLLLVAVIVVPSKVNSAAFSLPDPPVWEGPLEANDLLLQAERLFEGQLRGAESMVRQNGHLYTGTADGEILHIYKGEVETLLRLGQSPCGSYENEHTCGRPLGMRFNKERYLIVIDTYLGLYKINVATRDSFQMFPITMEIGQRAPKFLNDLDIASDGKIFMTDSSIFQRRDFSLDVLEGKSHGRLIEYDPATNKSKVLLENLYFANGVQLSKKEDFLLVAETTGFRITKYHLKGPKAGQAEVFIDNLPISPDNIRMSSSGGFWVTGCMCRGSQRKINIIDTLGPQPWIRSLLGKLPMWVIIKGVIPCGMILELDQSGAIVRSYMDLSGKKVSFLSEVEDDEGILYLGSFREPYISRLNTNRLNKEV